MTVYNDYEEALQRSNSYTRKVSVDSVLSIEAEVNGGAAAFLGAEGTAEVTLDLFSNYGVSYEVDWFDDSAPETVPVSSVGSSESVTHLYSEAGTYPVSIIVYDKNNKTNIATTTL